jgi:hypothetical protein
VAQTMRGKASFYKNYLEIFIKKVKVVKNEVKDMKESEKKRKEKKR